MADGAFRTYNLIMQSRGVSSRYVDDQTPESTFLNELNLEEREENAVGSRLGTSIINKNGSTVAPIAGGMVHSLAKLNGLNGQAWRYASAGGNLYRRSALTLGGYSLISSGLSGTPWMAVDYRPDISSMPYMYFADGNQMLKDNGLLVAPQRMGIKQPQYPVQAQAQAPTLIALDPYTDPSTSYSYSGVSGGTNGLYVNTSLTTAVSVLGVSQVSVADSKQPGLFQLLTIDGGGAQEETVLVLQVTQTGFVANFTKTHASGAPVQTASLSVTVPSSTTATVSKALGLPIASWPKTLQQADYIGLYLFVSDPSNIQSITIKFDVGDGTFNSDYFYKVIGQGPLQSLLDDNVDPTTAAADAVLSNSLGLYGNSAGSIMPLNTGLNQWTELLIQLSDFAGAGRADFNDPVFNWEAVRGYQIEIVTNETSSATVAMSSLVLFGGAGPDSLGGVAYDWLFTFYNDVDGTESNPCMVMTNVNPPNDTNWITPRRQPVRLTLIHPTMDSQTTKLRVYRQGGTLGDTYRRVDTIPFTGTQTVYYDISSDADIQGADIISFENDVPVTSTLPVPVETTLATPIATKNQVVAVFPASMNNISVGQQVTIGNLTTPDLLNDRETVIVLSLGSNFFMAFVQNTHGAGEEISATAAYCVPVTGMAQAYNKTWFWGDPNNPNYLYFSTGTNPQGVSSKNYVEVSVPGDPITAAVQFKGNLYVSTLRGWWAVAPGSINGGATTVYPTACKHGCVARLGVVATEEAIYYQGFDGLRAFSGGPSMYLTQEQEFIFQGTEPSDIVKADPTKLDQTRLAYWNMMLFFSYIGVDGQRYRLIFHAVYKRWRNDSVDAQSILLEVDTNKLIFGDSNGVIHQDRVGDNDEANSGGSVVVAPINFSLKIPYRDQGMPSQQKQYQELTVDCNTNNQPMTAILWFDDGAFSINVGTIITTTRTKFNITLNGGDGFQYYKVALELRAQATQPIYVFQASIRALALAKTRKSFDTYNLKFGTEESKFHKNGYFEYTSTEPIQCLFRYDDPCWPPYSFTLPSSGGVRVSMRVRLPAVKFAYTRLTGTSTADFQFWNDTELDIKGVCSGKGYSKSELANLEA